MRKLIRYLKGYVKESIIAPLFKFIEASFELIVPLVMAQIIDVGIKNNDVEYIIKMGILLLVLGVLGLGCAVTAQYFAAKASLGFGTSLRKDLYHHINTLSFAELDRIGVNTLVTRITADANQAQTGVNMFLRLFLRSPFIVIGSLVVCLTISLKLTLIFAVAAPIIGLIIYLVMGKTIPMYKSIQKKLDRVSLDTRENLSGAKVIRAFSRQENEAAEFEKNTDELMKAQLKTAKVSALLNPLTYVIVNIAIVLILWFGGVSVNVGEITQGEVIALVNYMNQILLALIYLANLIIIVTKSLASAARINDIFDVAPSIADDVATEITADKNSAAVEFKNVTFSYNEDAPSLENISFSAPCGSTIGVVGGTGSGKTTLVNLIPRFYDVQQGEVLINGFNVKKYPLSQLSRIIGVVPQRAVLFKGTIRENIQIGKENASDEEIYNALEIAQAKDFVEEKPEKLDTEVSQGGKNLSGGQRQRLTIARAVVASPEILILDDSASALDLSTDSKLRQALNTCLKNTTKFIVSQRATSIKNADLIIVLENGKCVGLGKHRELFENCSVYREICLSQMSEKEANSIEKK